MPEQSNKESFGDGLKLLDDLVGRLDPRRSAERDDDVAKLTKEWAVSGHLDGALEVAIDL